MASDNPKSYRLMYKFWLDMMKPEEEALADMIEKMKSARAYASAVRDGLRLINDLREGNISVLLELFPFVKTAIASGGNDSGGISKADLEELAALIKESKQEPPLAASSLQSIGGLKPLGGLKPIAPPSYEDEGMELVVSKAEGGGADATKNFLASMLALQQ